MSTTIDYLTVYIVCPHCKKLTSVETTEIQDNYDFTLTRSISSDVYKCEKCDKKISHKKILSQVNDGLNDIF